MFVWVHASVCVCVSLCLHECVPGRASRIQLCNSISASVFCLQVELVQVAILNQVGQLKLEKDWHPKERESNGTDPGIERDGNNIIMIRDGNCMCETAICLETGFSCQLES